MSMSEEYMNYIFQQQANARPGAIHPMNQLMGAQSMANHFMGNFSQAVQQPEAVSNDELLLLLED